MSAVAMRKEAAAAPEKSYIQLATTMQPAKKMNAAAPRLPAKSLVPTVEAARRDPCFTPGEDVEVRRRISQVAGKMRLVIYVRAKVVSASAGACSYLVQYPAANSVPSRTARVPASDIRAARRVPPLPDCAVDVARPASSKRPLLSEAQSERGCGGDCCKKTKKTGKGIPEDALQRFIAEYEKEEKAKKKALKLLPAPVKADVATTT